MTRSLQPSKQMPGIEVELSQKHMQMSLLSNGAKHTREIYMVLKNVLATVTLPAGTERDRGRTK